MEQLPPLGTTIHEIMSPTFRIYSAILPQNATAIHSTPKQTHQYGPLPRHTLDVYYPPTSPSTTSTTSTTNAPTSPPILLFLHGGGLVSGSRTLPPSQIPDDLAYANIGHYFASRYGYMVVIPNYRLMEHGARFPSGGEDVALVVEWLVANLGEVGPVKDRARERELFVLGHSAGGVHVATYLFGKEFTERRGVVLGMEEGDMETGRLRLRGVVLLCVPLHMRFMPEEAREMVQTYWSGRDEEDAPLGLLKALIAREGGVVKALPGVKFLALKGQYDAEDEVVRPLEEFVDVWMRSEGVSRGDLQVETLPGHNHISPVLSLGTGIPAEEAWGSVVGVFVNTSAR